MEEKDREISALRLIYDEEKKELDRLEAYFEKLVSVHVACHECGTIALQHGAMQHGAMQHGAMQHGAMPRGI